MQDGQDENLMLAYIEGDLDAKARADFEAALAKDEPTRLLVEQIIADRAMLRSIPAKAAPDDLMARVMAAMDQHEGGPANAGLPLAGAGQGSDATEPVVYRFRSWQRWAGGIAAMLAVSTGLMVHFDPFGWNQSDPIEIASGPGPKVLDHKSLPMDESDPGAGSRDAAAAGPELLQDKQAKRGESPATTAAADKFGEKAEKAEKLTDRVAEGAHADALAAKSDAAPLAATGKGTVALGMAKQAQEETLDGVLAAKPGEPGDALRWSAAGAPARSFQIELQTASALSTRQVVLAWAGDNDAFEASLNNTRQRGAVLKGRESAGDPAKTRRAINAQQAEADAASDSDLKDAGAPPAAALAEDARGDASKSDPAKADAAKKESLGAAATRAQAPGAAPAAAQGKRSEGEAAKDRAEAVGQTRSLLANGAPAADAFGDDKAEKAGTAGPQSRQELVLMVPADRINSLVEHIEAKTGQSLIVVREGNETLLLSPQVANQRALRKAQESERRKHVEELSSEKAAEKAEDGKQADSVVPVAPSSPSAPAAPASRPTPALPAPITTAPPPAPTSPSASASTPANADADKAPPVPAGSALPARSNDPAKPAAIAPAEKVAEAKRALIVADPEANAASKKALPAPPAPIMVRIVIVEEAK